MGKLKKKKKIYLELKIVHPFAQTNIIGRDRQMLLLMRFLRNYEDTVLDF